MMKTSWAMAVRMIFLMYITIANIFSMYLVQEYIMEVRHLLHKKAFWQFRKVILLASRWSE